MNGILVPPSLSHEAIGRKTRRVATSKYPPSFSADLLTTAKEAPGLASHDHKHGSLDRGHAAVVQTFFEERARRGYARLHPLRPVALPVRQPCAASQRTETTAPASGVCKKAKKAKSAPQKNSALQWVTTADPNEFKNPENMRTVRSKAMSTFLRQKQAQGGRQESEREGGTHELCADTTEEQAPSDASANGYRRGDQVTWLKDFNALSRSTIDCGAVNGIATPSEQVALLPWEDFIWEDSYEADDSLTARVNCHVLETMSSPYGGLAGDGLDPFYVLPQFKDVRFHSQALVRRCNRSLSTVDTALKWMPIILSSDTEVILSVVCFASAFTDMMDGFNGDSARSAYIKSRTIEWLRARIEDPLMQMADTTIMMTMHLLLGEVWVRDELPLRVHLKGLEKLVAQRGGMKRIPQTIAEVLECMALETCVFMEEVPHQMFRDYVPIWCNPSIKLDVLESPLFYPYNTFQRIPSSSKCSPKMLSLICDMRDLTDLFLTQHSSGAGGVASLNRTASEQYNKAVDSICQRIAALPSAHDHSHEDTARDYIYESCRIAALLYTRAITRLVPFSIVANIDTTDSAAFLPSLLYEALYLTDASECWDTDLSGVYHWVVLIGAAASRPCPATFRAHDSQYRMWVARCLVMYCSRVRTLLKFTFPAPLIAVLKTFGLIQEILSLAYYG